MFPRVYLFASAYESRCDGCLIQAILYDRKTFKQFRDGDKDDKPTIREFWMKFNMIDVVHNIIEKLRWSEILNF